ncbi:hypothetical protein NUW54_g7635 [Trametes sanguinea]|uniref:Uncharacterized protein n=1 Tax=Trametes sanguinea TaxID=158606 RepID=A0ACC1PK89_9APHY|nr:hypothetical protein NUW54_g7635 [Trametes sanguinea]
MSSGQPDPALSHPHSGSSSQGSSRPTHGTPSPRCRDAVKASCNLTLIIFVLSDGSIAPDGWKTGYIIALLIVGVVLVALFVWWEHYLEQLHGREGEMLDTWWAPPPLMSVTVWTRAKGKLAVVLMIAFLQWCGFQSFTFWIQLYYQDYAGYTPILTMIRIIPMFVTGVCCNFIVALVVGRIPVVYLIGELRSFAAYPYGV